MPLEFKRLQGVKENKKWEIEERSKSNKVQKDRRRFP